jgi:hypothetical protein
MRKFVALALVALLSLTMAIAMVGCGGQQEASSPEASPMTGTESTMDSSAMMPDTGMADTSSMQH